jgi:histidine triad (HIT) family protein
MPSLFTKIINREIPAQFVFEDDTFVAILDISPANQGHTLLIPRHEAQFIAQLPPKVQEKIGPTLAKLITAVKNGVGCPAVNVLVNDGPESNQAIPHAHIHVIPRFAGDGKVIHPKGAPYQGDEMAAMATKLRAAWNG